jgi:hypothetical protein
VGAARRVVAAFLSGVKLGRRALRTDDPKAVAADARPAIALAAQLAAEAGMPFLAGDLWTVLQKSFAEDADDKAVGDVLEKPPQSLAGVKELGPVIGRAKRTLRLVAEPLACTNAKVETGAYEEPSCDTYPLALSLRVVDAVKKLPHLRRGADTAPRCAPMRALDAFLTQAEQGRYDPDAFTRAVEELRADGRAYEAAVLLARQRHENHCNPAILSASRTLGRQALLGPLLRSDLLSTALNCGVAAGGPEVDADLVALDDNTRVLPDATRNLKVMLSVAELAVNTDRWGLITKLTTQPEFVDRWMSVHPSAATAALAIAHAVPAMNGGAVDLAKTKPSYDLLCETFPPGERAELCDRAKKLRAASGGAKDAEPRKQLAKETVRRVLAQFTNPGPAAPKP